MAKNEDIINLENSNAEPMQDICINTEDIDINAETKETQDSEAIVRLKCSLIKLIIMLQYRKQ